MNGSPSPNGRFAAHVRDALGHLHDYVYLQTHPLVEEVMRPHA